MNPTTRGPWEAVGACGAWAVEVKGNWVHCASAILTTYLTPLEGRCTALARLGGPGFEGVEVCTLQRAVLERDTDRLEKWPPGSRPKERRSSLVPREKTAVRGTSALERARLPATWSSHAGVPG